jgi:hypothetical protein
MGLVFVDGGLILPSSSTVEAVFVDGGQFPGRLFGFLRFFKSFSPRRTGFCEKIPTLEG